MAGTSPATTIYESIGWQSRSIVVAGLAPAMSLLAPAMSLLIMSLQPRCSHPAPRYRISTTPACFLTDPLLVLHTDLASSWYNRRCREKCDGMVGLARMNQM